MNNPNFWGALQADLIVGICWAAIMLSYVILSARYKKRQERLQEVAKGLFSVPRPPGLCPLCGRDWPLPGPVPSNQSHVVVLGKTLEKKLE